MAWLACLLQSELEDGDLSRLEPFPLCCRAVFVGPAAMSLGIARVAATRYVGRLLAHVDSRHRRPGTPAAGFFLLFPSQRQA